MLAWHFVSNTLRNGEPVPADGELLRVEPPIELCELGLHASERLIDALQYAPGNTICRVECGGEIKRDTDKLVATERTILWRVNGENILRAFARQCALDVAHLWDMPVVVREFLETGNENLRAAAWDAAWDAASVAASVAASAAASAAASVAASAVASATAWDAASVAARTAALVAALVAASVSVRTAAGDNQNKKLIALVMQAHEENKA